MEPSLPAISGLTGRAAGGRKLIAVAQIDMVGYSRLIGLDDRDTIARLQNLRRLLIDPAVDEHGGRIVQTAGDSLLIVFDSIDGAVRCAVKVQRLVPDYDGDAPPSRHIRFRIGINIGDVIAAGTDLHGDGVNVAVRLQTECPEGGVCVSQAVRDHVQDRLNLTFEELGSLALKNISRPLRAFVVREGEVGQPMEPAAMSHEVVVRPAAKATNAGPPGPDPVLPDKPSIAVLAFTNMSGDPDQEYFSDGIADDIITELSRSHYLFVIARNSSFTYKGRAVDVKQVARELAVRYVVEGSVRRSGHRVRVSAQLIDAITGSHIWAERYDREISEIFAVQDEIAEAVATAIQPAVGDAEQWRALRKPPASLSTWETYQRGLWHLSKGTAAENEQAREFFHRAAEIDFGFAPAYVGLALTYIRDGLFHGTRPIAEAARLAAAEARKAVSTDPNDSTALAALGTAHAIGGSMDAAMVCAERALAYNRNCALTHWVKGSVLRYWGRHHECRDEVYASLRLNPRDSMSATTASLSPMSWYLEGKYADAVVASLRCLADYPAYAAPRRFLVAALAQLGRREEAAAELREFITMAPDVFNVMVRNRPPYMSPGDQEHLLEGIRKAGWND
jgi:adenylate cyclase